MEKLRINPHRDNSSKYIFPEFLYYRLLDIFADYCDMCCVMQSISFQCSCKLSLQAIDISTVGSYNKRHPGDLFGQGRNKTLGKDPVSVNYIRLNFFGKFHECPEFS